MLALLVQKWLLTGTKVQILTQKKRLARAFKGRVRYTMWAVEQVQLVVKLVLNLVVK